MIVHDCCHRCRDDGRFQNKPWFPCRDRQTCLKPPARPPTRTGLDFSQSVGVKEFDEAVYKCIDGADPLTNAPIKRVRANLRGFVDIYFIILLHLGRHLRCVTFS